MFDPENDPLLVLGAVNALLAVAATMDPPVLKHRGVHIKPPTCPPPPPPPSCQLDGLEIDLDVTEIRSTTPKSTPDKEEIAATSTLESRMSRLSNYPDLVAEAYSSIENPENFVPLEKSAPSRHLLESALLLIVLASSLLLLYLVPPS